MKKIACIILVFLLFLVSTQGVYAHTISTASEKAEIEYFEDGSYIVTWISFSQLSTKANSITRQKTSDYYNSSNVLEWSVTLTASFSYTGTYATCTTASVSHTIYDSAWRVTSETASKSGNTATGDFTIKHYFLGIPTKTVNKTLTMTCSPSGVVS